MYFFYHPEVDNNPAFLDEEESFHCTKVLRLKDQEIISILNGKGTVARARIIKSNTKRVQFEVIDKKQIPSRPFQIHLAIAPPKNQERLEWMVEKATEIGVDKITLLKTENTEKWKIRYGRLQKKMISAIKQSGNPFLPVLDEFIPYEELINSTVEDQLFICYVDPENKQHPKDVVKKGKSYCILIGPEGDFTFDELAKAEKRGFIKLSLGNTRLRTETAGLTAVITLNMLNS